MGHGLTNALSSPRLRPDANQRRRAAEPVGRNSVAYCAVWPGMNDFGRRVNLNNRIVISTPFGCVICATGWADRESKFKMDGILPFKRLLDSFLGR